jgi:hypothetical protein
MRLPTIMRWQCSGSPLETEQADRLSLRKRDGLAEIEESLGLLHMSEEDPLEAFDVTGARRLAAALRRAEPAQMAVADSGLGKMGRELVLRKPLLARDGCGANVEDERNASLFERAEKSADRSAFIADGADRLGPHVGRLLPSP